MSLLPFRRGGFMHAFDDMLREMDRFERAMHREMTPYWRSADWNNLCAGTDVGQITDDEKAFNVRMDVSHFRPEQLKVNLDNRMLTVSGEQEDRHSQGYSKRAFTRQILLPEDVDVEAVRSHLSDHGHLSIEAPKLGHTNAGRAIPIEHKNHQQSIKQ